VTAQQSGANPQEGGLRTSFLPSIPTPGGYEQCGLGAGARLCAGCRGSLTRGILGARLFLASGSTAEDAIQRPTRRRRTESSIVEGPTFPARVRVAGGDRCIPGVSAGAGLGAETEPGPRSCGLTGLLRQCCRGTLRSSSTAAAAEQTMEGCSLLHTRPSHKRHRQPVGQSRGSGRCILGSGARLDFVLSRTTAFTLRTRRPRMRTPWTLTDSEACFWRGRHRLLRPRARTCRRVCGWTSPEQHGWQEDKFLRNSVMGALECLLPAETLAQLKWSSRSEHPSCFLSLPPSLFFRLGTLVQKLAKGRLLMLPMVAILE